MPPNSRADAALAGEELHHAHAGEVLLQVAVEPRQQEPDVAEGLAHPAAEDRARAARRTGITANATSASRQSATSIRIMMAASVNRSPNTVTTPEEKSSFSVSTSEVTRVMRRPDRVPVEVRNAETLQVREDLEAQVAHDALADVGGHQLLRVGQHELDQQRAQGDEREGAQQAEVAAAGTATSSARSVRIGLTSARPAEARQQEQPAPPASVGPR